MRRIALALAALASFAADGAAAATAAALPDLDLAAAFHTGTPWRLTASRGPAAADMAGNPEPGAIAFCLGRRGQRCALTFADALRVAAPDDFDVPHEAEARIVRLPGGRPMLLLRLASVHSGDGDQRVATLLLAYDATTDLFRVVFRQRTGRNNNQEVRYVEAGPLAGAVIAAEPTQDKPFGYRIVVSRMAEPGGYRAVLRYRSATRYGDGNPLAAIDSEMPAIQRRLGLWRPGQPLPAPATCASPHMVRGALWCG